MNKLIGRCKITYHSSHGDSTSTSWRILPDIEEFAQWEEQMKTEQNVRNKKMSYVSEWYVSPRYDYDVRCFTVDEFKAISFKELENINVGDFIQIINMINS